GAQDGVGTKHQVNSGCGPPHSASLAVTNLIKVVTRRLPGVIHVSEVDEEVIAQNTFPVSKHTVLGAAVIGAQHSHTSHQHGHFRRGEPHKLGTIKHQLFRWYYVVLLQPVAITIVYGLKGSEGFRI